MKNWTLALLTAFITAMAPAAFAVSNVPVYVGFGVGDARIANGGGDATFSSDYFAYSAFAGYELTPNFAAEVGYINLGTQKDPSFCSVCTLKPYSINVSAVGTLPISSSGFEIFGKAGVAFLTLNYDCAECNTSTETQEAFAYGGGLGYKYKNLKVRAEADWINAKNIDTIRSLMLTASYNFTL